MVLLLVTRGSTLEGAFFVLKSVQVIVDQMLYYYRHLGGEAKIQQKSIPFSNGSTVSCSGKDAG